MSPSLVMDGMPHGSGGSDLSGYAALIDEELTKLKEQRLESIKIYADISSRIRKVKDDNQRELLMYRYIKCMKWEEIAVEMKYSWRNIHKIHSRALDSVDFEKCMEVHTKSVI